MFSKLPLYSNWPFEVRIAHDPEFAAALHAVIQAANTARPHHQVAVLNRELYEAINREPLVHIKVALLLQWLTAARVGCILQLVKDCIELSEDGAMTVQFRAGKGVQVRGLYSVKSKVPLNVLPMLREYLGSLEPGDLIVPPTLAVPRNYREKRMREALRRVNPTLNHRAMRRGALQAMAKAGASVETLMQFSGHLRESTLRGYLDWGRTLESAAAGAQEAAELGLFPQL